MLLDTGSQITTLSKEYESLITHENSIITDTISTSATGQQTDPLTKVQLTLGNGNVVNAYYSPMFHSNLMSIPTLTQELGKVALITQGSTHVFDNKPSLINKVVQLLGSTPGYEKIQNKKALVPISLKVSKSPEAPEPTIPFIPIFQKWVTTNQLGKFPLTKYSFEADSLRLGSKFNVSQDDLHAFRVHDFYHYKLNKLREFCLFPISPLVKLYIDTCPLCKLRPQVTKKRSKKNPDDETNKIKPTSLFIEQKLNKNFIYQVHIDTAKMDPNCRSSSVQSVLVIVLKPHNYIKLIPLTTSQPTMAEVCSKTQKFLLHEIGIAPLSITTDRGNEFNSIHSWAASHDIQSIIAATGDSPFNGVVERYIKEVSLQYGLLSTFLKDEQVKYFNHILLAEIMNRLNSDRRANSHSPNYYIHGKDISPRYINKGLPLFSDVMVKTANGLPRRGLHLGYHLATNRSLVYLLYDKNVGYNIQMFHHTNIQKLNTYQYISMVEREITFPKEVQTNSLSLTPPQYDPLESHSTLNKQDYVLIDAPSSPSHQAHFVMTNQVDISNIDQEASLDTILDLIKNDKPIPLDLALAYPETRQAMKEEIGKWIMAKAIVPYVSDKKTKPTYATSFWIHTIKKKVETTFKARLISIIPSTTHTAKIQELYSPVTNKTSILSILHKALTFGHKLATLDVAGAFLQAPTSHKLLVLKAPAGFNELAKEIDPSFETATHYKIEKALYGLKDSPLQWNKTLLKYLHEDNFFSSTYDQCLLFHKTCSDMAMAAHVDDIIYTLPRNGQQDLLTNTFKKRKLNITNNLSTKLDFLGLTYNIFPSLIKVDIVDYLKKSTTQHIHYDKVRNSALPNFFAAHYEIIKALHKGILKAPDELEPHLRLNSNELPKLSTSQKSSLATYFEKDNHDMTTKYKKLITTFDKYRTQSTLYITTLPDFQKYLGIAGYITNVFHQEFAIYHITLSSFNTQYNLMAAFALQHFISFLYKSPKMVHNLRPIRMTNNHASIVCYSDANWSRFDNSYSGFIITIGDEVIYSKSKRQQTFSTSSFIAELKAVYMAIQKSYEIVARYSDTLQFKSHSLDIKCDNMAVIKVITSQSPLHTTIIANNLQHQILSLRDDYNNQRYNIEYINTKDNPADLFTKPHGSTELDRLLKLKTFKDFITYESPE